MKRRLVPLLPLLLLAPGCGLGSSDATPSSDDSDKPAAALACLEEAGVPARAAGDNEIQVGDGGDGPRIRFYLTSGQAQAEQFAGKGEGAELIGQALLFVRDGTDDLLEQVENCLAEL